MTGLKPGDVLLYKPSSVYGWVIAVKTWHAISHVEVYVGNGQSVASRDGIGVGQYAVRDGDVAIIMRPIQPFNLPAAMTWFQTQKGQPYGWLDLAAFVGWNGDGKGVVCSPFATQFLRAGGLPIFNQEPPNKIAPFEFILSELLIDVTRGVPA